MDMHPNGPVGDRFIDRAMAPLRRFLGFQSAGGILVLAATAIALAAANSPWASAWHHLWHDIPVSLGFGSLRVEHGLGHWINDGVMVIFFLLVGLEIKRELTNGELASMRKAMLPIAGAIGGMVVPAAIYAAFNHGTATAAGWGIPMATDIAFAVGVLRLLGARVPLPLVVFLTALAIVDDLGAVLVIALFYTAQVSLPALATAGGLLAALALLNRLGVRATLPYAILGIGLWIAVLNSGVHATVAGVLLACTIPTAGGTMARWEQGLHPWVVFVIVPVFALANAGVAIAGSASAAFLHPVGWGIIAGLVVGKPLGITGAAWIAVRTGLAELPAGVRWSQVWGVAALGGIGFTMSLFIANLAFPGSPYLEEAKLAILTASLLATILGVTLIVRRR